MNLAFAGLIVQQVREIDRAKVKSYLGRLTINGVSFDEPDIDPIIDSFENEIINNFPKELWEIRTALLIAHSLDIYSDKIENLEKEWVLAEETLPIPEKERVF